MKWRSKKEIGGDGFFHSPSLRVFGSFAVNFTVDHESLFLQCLFFVCVSKTETNKTHVEALLL